MCGIGAYIGEESQNAGIIVKDMIKRLEYRGYDSAGLAVRNGSDINCDHRLDNIARLEEPEGDAAIGHARWSTHGEPSEANAHPHDSCDQRFWIVHNGIIENHEEIKEGLEETVEKYDVLDEHVYTSDTDSEVIAHYLETDLKENSQSPTTSLRMFNREAEGNYAIVVLDRKSDKLYALRNGSPLVIGEGVGENFIGSDLYSFSPYTGQAYFMEDGDIAEISKDDIIVNGKEVETEKFEWTQEEKELGSYEHWMRKEIDEIPSAIQGYLDSIIGDQSQNINQIAEKLKESERVIFTASGSSYHASLLGVYYLQKAGVEAQALIASEFENYERVDENTTVIAVSQSGETRDVLDAIRYSRERGADIVSLVNAPHSTIQRASDYSLEIRAGQEICVAATKTFTNQLVALLSIAQRMGYDIDLNKIPEKTREAIDVMEGQARSKAEQIDDDVYIIGKGETYPVAREISLKMKEIAYNHSEGMMAGELKHGTLALVEDGTPIIALNSENNGIESTVEEVSARGADVEVISSDNDEYLDFKASIYGFLLSYYLGKSKGNSIDKPSNLAKSVTVK